MTMEFPRRQFLRLAAGATAPPGRHTVLGIVRRSGWTLGGRNIARKVGYRAH
jgi:hypothetical protein